MSSIICNEPDRMPYRQCSSSEKSLTDKWINEQNKAIIYHRMRNISENKPGVKLLALVFQSDGLCTNSIAQIFTKIEQKICR